VTDVSWEIPRTTVGNRIVVVAWAVFALAAVGTGVLIYQAAAGSDGGVSDPLPTTTVAPVSTGTSTPSTATSSVAVSPTLKPPLLPAAAAKPTPAGAAAFFRHFWATVNYSYASLDSAPLRGISAPSCKSCAGYADAIDNARAEGNTFAGGVVTVTEAVAAPGGDVGTGLVVNALLTQEAAFTVTAAGETGIAVPSAGSLRFDAAVRWQDGKWIMGGMDSRE
jgi:hypothetical protein